MRLMLFFLGWFIAGFALWVGFLACIELVGKLRRRRTPEMDEHDPYYIPTMWRRR